ncbi:MAG: hypothetical protein HC896_14930 [Bacteroidales bacterium]|nr:hypothetical protein [Bacteroidales bacterium]
MITACYLPYTLNFIDAAGTSRGTMHTRQVWFLILQDSNTQKVGIGEVAPLPGLSIDNIPHIEAATEMKICSTHWPRYGLQTQWAIFFNQFPSIKFALETAWPDLKNGGNRQIFNVSSYRPIPINGLIWMGSFEEMKAQVDKRLKQASAALK